MSENTLIRAMVRGNYAIQKLRIQMGNRITMNFKHKLGLNTDGMSESEMADASLMVLKKIRESYARITDGIVVSGEEGDLVTAGKLPPAKKFKGDDLISSYAELVLVDQYIKILIDEELNFHNMESVLSGIPIYDKFLADIPGCGNKMAAVIISEVDIAKAEYPSSLEAYAGLDVILVGKYNNDKGVEKIINPAEIDIWFEQNAEALTNEEDVQMLAEGKYPVTITSEGRSRKSHALVKREYVNKDGVKAIRDSISFNPFLKTKLIGVLGPAMLKTGKIYIDNERMGAAKRLELAMSEGMKKPTGKNVKQEVLDYLKQKHSVTIDYGPYAGIYYDYKNRIENEQPHLTPGHRHNMAIRYMIKQFLKDLYKTWRGLEGLVVADTYEEAKLGFGKHGKASQGKKAFVSRYYARMSMFDRNQKQKAA